MRFPKHDISLSLTHNEYKGYYETIEHAVGSTYCKDDWISHEQFQKSIDTGEVWELIWYPDTPIGSYRCIAADLDVLMEYVNKEFPDE